jgi:hypothetical protein
MKPIVIFLCMFVASPAAAQNRPLDSLTLARDRPAPVGEFAAGVLMFPDEGVVTEGFVGGAGRFYLLPRISVGPEVAYISGDRHSHLMLTGNMTFDFLGPENGQPRPVTPFAVVGGGLFRSRYIFPENEIFTHNEGSFTAGGGIRVRMADRVVAGVEARLGWETHIRLNGFIGVRF